MTEPSRGEAILRDKIRQLDRQLVQAQTSNNRLVEALQAARNELQRLNQALDREAPDTTLTFGTVIAVRSAVAAPPLVGMSSSPTAPAQDSHHATSATREAGLDVLAQGRKVRVRLHPLLKLQDVSIGDEVLLTDSLEAVAVYPNTGTGDVMHVKEVLSEHQVMVIGRGEDTRVYSVPRTLAGERIRVGDAVVVDHAAKAVTGRLELQEVQDLIVEQTPDVTYGDIGGLENQIQALTDAVEMPFLHKDLYREHKLAAPKGILLYGPPGCGKTLIAKAVANSLASRMNPGAADAQSFFLNVKGPELLDKYVGETERHIRTIFARAREKASEGHPVIVFFDEMDSLFRTRGSGVSSDVETTIVPQLLAEIDGVERLDNVIVIGATNREDMLDPALLRPGRLDVKIRVARPNRTGAAQILAKHLDAGVPVREGASAERLIGSAVEEIFSSKRENELAVLGFSDGTQQTLFLRDVVSGAVLRNVVDRAKKLAIKDALQGRGRGVSDENILAAVAEERLEQEDLPSATNPEEWAQVLGQRGKRVASLMPAHRSRTASVLGAEAASDGVPTGEEGA